MPSHTRPLRAATFLAPCNRALYEHVARTCGASTLIDGGDWRELAGGSIDIAFICSPPVIWLGGAVQAIAAPVLKDSRFGHRPLYTSDVIVRRDSVFELFDDLKGSRWAVTESSSWSGYWVTFNRIGSWRFFSELVTAGSHARAMEMVVDGSIDGAAIDSHVLQVMFRGHPQLLSNLRVIGSFDPAPIQPVVVRSTLEPELKARLAERILGLEPATLREFLVERFVAAPDYSPIANVVRSGFAPETDSIRG